ncbi:MAG: PAS domain S-box protein [Calothrix sp. C42_A2020_038]|nr:PAS domain S-box protein [Calothrix sp. C42_A2020_038]
MILTENKSSLGLAAGQTDIVSQVKDALLDITNDAIIVHDLNGTILLWNQGAQKIYGWSAKQSVGKKHQAILYDDDDLEQLEEPLQQVVKTGKWQGELNQITKDGKDIVVEAHWSLIRDNYGNPCSILTAATNITDNKQLQAQLLHAQRLENIGTLASGIAHDLNNILTPILAATQLLPLKNPNLDAKSRELLKILADNSKRGIDLIKQILSFGCGNQDKRAVIQVRYLITEVLQVARQTFPRSIEINMDLPTKDLWTISANTTQLHQVLMNLCVNARDAMPNGGTLKLAAENLYVDENYSSMNLDAHAGSYVVITITDTGCGIKPEDKERIFEPFFTTKEVGKGTGLGLSTVLSIIKNHGGFINVDSEVRKGTSFKLYLPAVEATVTQVNQEAQPLAGQGELILIVDDEESIRKITSTSLETYNYHTLTARDGIEAITLFAQYKSEVKAILLDLMMPSLDSMTTIQTLLKINPQIPIIVMSGLASNEITSKLVSTDVQAYLTKPFTAWELLNTLQQALN